MIPLSKVNVGTKSKDLTVPANITDAQRRQLGLCVDISTQTLSVKVFEKTQVQPFVTLQWKDLIEIYCHNGAKKAFIAFKTQDKLDDLSFDKAYDPHSSTPGKGFVVCVLAMALDKTKR